VNELINKNEKEYICVALQCAGESKKYEKCIIVYCPRFGFRDSVSVRMFAGTIPADQSEPRKGVEATLVK
jgi:hypothetical protein